MKINMNYTIEVKIRNRKRKRISYHVCGKISRTESYPQNKWRNMLILKGFPHYTHISTWKTCGKTNCG